MISIDYLGDDRFILFGIHHFLKKSGLPIQVNSPSGARVHIAYEKGVGNGFQIILDHRELENHLPGKIQVQNEFFPLFEIPADTGERDQVIATYIHKDGAYPCITRSPEGVRIGFDLFHETGRLLTGYLDTIWGNLSTTERDFIAGKPVVDFLEDILAGAIHAGARECGIQLPGKLSWPDGKTFAVALTHDVDETAKTYQWISSPLKNITSGKRGVIRNQVLSFLQKLRGKEPYWTFPEILRIEEGMGVKSSFYFLKETAPLRVYSPDTWHHWGRNRSWKKPELVRTIRTLHNAGFEVGLHGSFNSYENFELLWEEKKELEEVLGDAIEGVRQHHLNLRIPVTWRYHQDAGLRYDTSLGYKDRNGFRYGTCFPFNPLDNGEELQILEIPLVIMDINVSMDEKGWERCAELVNEVEKRGGVLTILWHPPVFNDLEYPLAGKFYQRIIEMCKARDAWVTSAGDIARWWGRIPRGSPAELEGNEGV